MATVPKKVFHGTRAQKIRALQRRLTMIRNMDGKEQERAAFLQVDPDLFVDSARMQAAFARLEEQCSDLLALKR